MKPLTNRCLLVPLAMMSMILVGWYAHANQNLWIREKFQGQTSQIQQEREEFVQERLEEAEIIWKQGIISREAAEIESPIDAEKPWVHVSFRTIWDFFYPNFNCPHLVERFGRLGDGGKWVCGISHIQKRADHCLMYSYGIAGDTSFEQDILNRTSCVVYAFDHTVEADKVALTKLYPSRSLFTKIGLGHEDIGQLRTLKTEMSRHGHTFIDIFKIDIEGGEYLSIPKILKDFPDHLPFGQLLIEIHLDLFPQRDLYKHFKSWWVSLEKAGLRAFRTEPNLFPILLGDRKPSYYEISFMNTQVDHALLHA